MLLTLPFTITHTHPGTYTYTLTALLVGVCREISIRVIILISMHIYALPDGRWPMDDLEASRRDYRQTSVFPGTTRQRGK